MSEERYLYLNRQRRRKRLILSIQVIIFLSIIFIWELLAKYNVLNTFITSSPSLILKEIILLFNNNNLFNHIFITTYEVLLSLILSLSIGFIIALLLYISPIIKEIFDPFITLFNSIPKVALGPILIIWFGAGIKSIIINALLISIIVTFTSILNGFNNVSKNKIKIFKLYNSSLYDLITILIIPESILSIIETIKLNLSLTLIGVIMGEFLSCKEGIGYLILYGTQVFNLSLVMSGIILLLFLSFLFYVIIEIIKKKLK